MTKLYSNENFDYQVVTALRSLGYDVLTAFQAGNANQRIPDDQVLAFATMSDRGLLTFNRLDFFALHRSNPNHSGIIACTYDNNFMALAERIHHAIEREQHALAGKLIRIYKP